MRAVTATSIFFLFAYVEGIFNYLYIFCKHKLKKYSIRLIRWG